MPCAVSLISDIDLGYCLLSRWASAAVADLGVVAGDVAASAALAAAPAAAPDVSL